MTNEPEKRYSNGYRLSDQALKIWTRITFSIMGVGLAGLAVVIIVTASIYGNAPVEDIPVILINLMWVFGGIALAIPLALGAIVGGLAIHRLGWIPLLFVILGILAMGLSKIYGLGFLSLYGIIGIIVGVVGIFFLAIFRTKVDIWLGLPVLDSPRFYVRKNKGSEQDQKNDQNKN
jgi:hypothetical protein